jgi:hypothetical protein
VRAAAGAAFRLLPNVVVQTHEGRRALFYNDLLRGKTVLVHCMSIADETRRPALDSLRAAHHLLGERMGRDVFMYSLTVDPEHDTPGALAAFAERQQTGAGSRGRNRHANPSHGERAQDREDPRTDGAHAPRLGTPDILSRHQTVHPV